MLPSTTIHAVSYIMCNLVYMDIYNYMCVTAEAYQNLKCDIAFKFVNSLINSVCKLDGWFSKGESCIKKRFTVYMKYCKISTHRKQALTNIQNEMDYKNHISHLLPIISIDTIPIDQAHVCCGIDIVKEKDL